MFVITTAGSDKSLLVESRAVATAKAKYLSQKYRRTFKVTEVVLNEDFAPAKDEPVCPCGATATTPCVTKSGGVAKRPHKTRSL